MSVEDLLTNWEEALAVTLSQPDGGGAVTAMHGDILTNVADQRIAVRIQSNVYAGTDTLYSLACQHGSF